jgi:large subunit ribosomal protein L6
MSRIGKKPIPIPKDVKVDISGSAVKVKGSKGELARTFPPFIELSVDNGQVKVGCRRSDAEAKAIHGTARSLIAGMITGVQQGYTKELEIQGVGYRANVQGKKLVLSLGYSHPKELMIPDGIKVEVKDNTNIIVSGADKHMVGEVCARLKAFYPPEPYKGKGVRIKGEYVRRKAGKTVA